MRVGLGIAASLAALVAAPVAAQDVRQLGPHVHGQSHLTVAVEGTKISMELHAPGSDIVGFEFVPTTPAQTAAVVAATNTLKDPIALFGIPAAAQCRVTKAEVTLAEEDEDEDEQKPAAGNQTAAAPPAPAGPAAPKHSEFQANYELTCGNVAGIGGLNFLFFAKFSNATTVHVDLIGTKGAFSFDVPKSAPAVSTRNMF